MVKFISNEQKADTFNHFFHSCAWNVITSNATSIGFLLSGKWTTGAILCANHE